MVLSIICMLILTANTCKNEKDELHYDLVIRNNSVDSVKMAYKFYYDDLCILQGITIKSGESYTEHSYKQSWEDRLSNGRTQEIYIVDPLNFNPPNLYYNCDSIEVRNKVLKHYTLTLDDLKKSDFIVTYP